MRNRRISTAAAAMVIAVSAVLGGALPAGAADQPVGTDSTAGSGLGGPSGAAGTWSTAPEGATTDASEAQSPAPRSLSVPAPAPAAVPNDAATGVISGTVSYAASDDAPERPGDGTMIELARFVPETDGFVAVADAAGPAFQFAGLEPGTYRLHFIDTAQQDVRNEYYDDELYESDADLVEISAGETATVTASLDPWGIYTYRYGGATRYDVAALISTLAFDPGVPVIYIASGEKFPDALSAGPAAAHQNGALLLTAPDSVPTATIDAIATLRPQKLVVVGGEAAISAKVYDQLAGLQANITRIAGADRYEVSRKIIDYAFCDQSAGECAVGAKYVFVATGANFPDALSAGPAVAHLDGAVLLVPGGAPRVDAATASLLNRLGTDRIFVAGGPASVNSAMESSLSSLLPSGGMLSRLSGADRYETSAVINSAIFDTGETALLASGAGFADALSGGPVAATIDAPLFLAQHDCYPESIWNAIRAYDPVDLLLLGGPNALSDSVLHVEYLC